jgi:hypothetical protein
LALLDNPNHLGDQSPPSYVTSPFVAALIFGDIIPPFGGSNKVRLSAVAVLLGHKKPDSGRAATGVGLLRMAVAIPRG